MIRAMKHALLALLAAAASAAAAAPIAPLTPIEAQALVAHCQCVMDAGVCAIETRRPIATGPVRYGDRTIRPADVNFLTVAGPQMCVAARKELAKSTTSDRAFVIRQRWRKDFSVCPYPSIRATTGQRP